MGSIPVFFHAIRIDIPVTDVYRRLGYRKGTTEITREQQAEIDTALLDAQSVIELKGSAVSIPIREYHKDKVLLESEDMLTSSSLARMLEGSTDVLFMGATAGSQVMEEISMLSKNGSLTHAVMLDAAASEMTDKALQWITQHMGRELRLRGKALTSRRFSAGYGDFALENQRIMFERLKLDQLGVQLTDSCILLPEKSVTAVAGIHFSTIAR